MPSVTHAFFCFWGWGGGGVGSWGGGGVGWEGASKHMECPKEVRRDTSLSLKLWSCFKGSTGRHFNLNWGTAKCTHAGLPVLTDTVLV